MMNSKNEPQVNAVSLDAQGNGSLEKFIARFNRFEAEADVFSYCRDDRAFFWWDVTRYTVQFAIAIEKNFVGSKKEKLAAKSKRLFRLAQHIVKLGRFILSLASLKSQKIDTLYVSTRALDADLAPLLEKASVLYINKTGVAKQPHQALSKVTVDFLLRLIIHIVPVPTEVTSQASQVAAGIKDRFDVDADLCGPMLHKYKQARVSFWIWEIILSRLPALKRILFVNDDTLRPLVSLADKKGIETIEIQHGYIGKSHFAYSYPPLSFDLSTLPDKILVTRDTGDIVFPVPKLAAKVRERITSPELRDIDVLVGGSPTRSEEMRDIVKVLAESGLEFSLAVKLHPAQTEESSGLRSLFSADAVTIFDGSEDFIALARRSYIYIPANPTSTTVFEAVEAGADLITINYAGQKLTTMCDQIATAEVNNLDSLGDMIINHLKRRQR